MAILLAPMEGVVDPVIRDLLTRRGGYDLCVTEFVRVTHQLLPPKVYYRYCPELMQAAKTKAGVTVLVQLLGSDLERLLENAQQAISLGAPGIDLNFGCPAKTVNRHEGGAKLLESPAKLYDIISYLRKNLPAEIPVSAKIRLGYKDKSLYGEILSALKEAEPSWLTIHARTKQEAYTPPAHWPYIGEARTYLSRFPVIANGDIWTEADAKACYQETGCTDFMLGRGAIADPALATRIKSSSWYLKAREKTAYPNMDSEFGHLLPERHPGPLNGSWNHQRRLLNLMHLHPHYQSRRDIILPKLKQWTRQLRRHHPEAETLFEEIKRLKEPHELGEQWHL